MSFNPTSESKVILAQICAGIPFKLSSAMIYYGVLMQSYPARALGRILQVDWARDPREGPRVLMSLRVDFEPMG